MRPLNSRVVFVSGIFNVVHPGHLRLLRFARELGDRLIVGVLSDDLAGEGVTVSDSSRLEAIQSLRMVDDSFIIRGSVAHSIQELRPDIVVKGREHLHQVNEELDALEHYGGRLIFSSGDSFFNSTDLIRAELESSHRLPIELPIDFMAQHEISRARLRELVLEFSRVRVLVIGDSIVDEYVACHPLGMSREDPTLVVTPIETNRFIGGAAIVAGHAARLGAVSTFQTIVGLDAEAAYLREELNRVGVRAVLHEDDARPTTTKQRFRAGGKTLLRVSRLRQDAIPEDLQSAILESISTELTAHDLVIFSDFNYGALPQALVDSISAAARLSGLTMAADSQTSSQVGDVARFTGMDLITPTEYEARVACRNFDDGLVVLADELRGKSQAHLVLMTLGEDGILIRGDVGSRTAKTDRIPALNLRPVDVAGAGDSLLVVGSMALVCGASMYEAALLGSIAAAVQVSTTGNTPLSREQLLKVIAP